MKNIIDRTTISIGEAAALLGVHIDTIRNWEKRGLLNPSLTPGGHRRFSKLEVQNLIGKEKMSDKIVDRWVRTGLLEGIDDVAKKRNVALALENQRIFNETQDLPPRFRRISIPMIRRVLGGTSLPFSSSLYIRDDVLDNPTVTDLVYQAGQDINTQGLLDAEANYVATLCQEICDWLYKTRSSFNFKAFGLVDGKIAIYGL